MALVCSHRSLQNYSKLVLLLGLISILIFIWITLKMPGQDVSKAYVSSGKYPASDRNDDRRDGVAKKLEMVNKKVNGLIRIDIEDILFDNIAKKLEIKDIHEEMKELAEGYQEGAEHPGQVETVSTKPSNQVMTVSKASAVLSRHVTFKNRVKSNLSRHVDSKNVHKDSIQNISKTSRLVEKGGLAKKNARYRKKPQRKNKKIRKLVQGYLNMYVWSNICSSSIDSLRDFLLFPFAPNYRSKTTTLNVTLNMNNFGQWLFGYLRPHTSGNYQFNILSRGSLELWLSSDRSPKNLRIVAGKKFGDAKIDSRSKKLIQPISVELKSGNLYYIEILHKQGDDLKDYFEIVWRNSSTNIFSPIPSSSLVSTRDDSARRTEYRYSDIRRTSFAHEQNILSKQSFEKILNTEISERYEAIDEHVVKNVLQSCEYKPSYLIHYKLVRFQGARNKSNTRFVKIYPADSSNESLALVKGEEWWEKNAIGNILLDNKTVMDVARTFMEALEEKYPRKYKLQKIVSIRSTSDERKGDRFFLNLRIHDKTTNSSKVLTKHVFKKKDNTTLCYPGDFRWDPEAVVNVIVPVKDSSTWALALVKNIEEIVSSRNDSRINLIILDYGSQDMDIKRILQQSSIASFQVVTLPRNESFRRAVALQSAANAIRDPHGILFFCDLHLRIPRNLFALIRQHCVEGKMAFAPVVKRLRCGSHPSLPFGYWETLGFGLLAIYKSDFDRVGGMDAHTFKQWGGEDWELLDRVLMSGIEVERLKIPAFYHFYHPATSNSRHNA